MAGYHVFFAHQWSIMSVTRVLLNLFIHLVFFICFRYEVCGCQICQQVINSLFSWVGIEFPVLLPLVMVLYTVNRLHYVFALFY